MHGSKAAGAPDSRPTRRGGVRAPSAGRARDEHECGPAAELLVVDSGVSDIAALTAAVGRPCHVVQLPESAEGLTALASAVETFGPAAVVHLVGHGAPGRLRLGSTDLTVDEIRRRPVHVAALAGALAGTPILLYGCEVGAGEAGTAFLDALAIAVGAPVRASDTKVGNPALGGSWNLDVGSRAGQPLFDAERSAGWHHLLAVDVTTTAGDASAGSLQAAAVSGQQVVNFSNLGSGATINLTGSPTFTLGFAASLNFTGTTTSLTISGSNIVADSHLYITVSAGQTLTLNTGFTLNGAGKTLLAQGGGTVAYNGSVSSSNTLQVAGGTTAEIGTTTSTAKFDVVGNSTVRFTTDATYTSALEIENTATIDTNGHNVALSGAVTDDGTNVLLKTGTGTLTLSGTNSASGTMTISQGTLSVAADGNLSAGAVTINGGTLAVTGAATIDNAVSLGASNGTVSLSADATFSGVVSGTGSLTKTGTGVLTLSGSNTFSGGTSVSAGTVKLSGGSALADAGSVSVSSGATLDLNGTTESVGTLSGAGNVSIGAGTLTVAQGADATFSGVLSGTGGGLTKTGSGVLTLSGSNTFSGTTTISGGTLRLSGGSAIADGATVNVGAGATLDLNGTSETIGALTGSGTVTIGAGSISFSNPGANSFSGTLSGTGTFSVASGVTLKGTGTYSTPVEVLSGGIIAPGNSPGTLSTGNLTLASGSTATMEIDGTVAGTGYDQVVVTGTVTINSATLNTVFGYTSATGDSYVLISNDGADAVTGTFSGLAEGATFTSGGRQYRISYAGNDGNDVTLTDAGAVPASSSGGDGGTASDSGPYSLVGSTSDETFFGSDGADTVSAMTGDDQVYASRGADLAYGNQGDDSLWGNADADSLFGGQDADLVYGNQGIDLLYGNRGTDTLYGGQDADTAYGGQDADILYGNLGDDRLFGNLGNDIIYGGQGADTLSGGAGNDLLVGGTDADRIAVGSGDGVDTVSGFSTSDGDVIAVAANVNGTGIATAADLLGRLSSDADGNAVLDLGSGNTLTLMGVRTTELSAADFLIA